MKHYRDDIRIGRMKEYKDNISGYKSNIAGWENAIISCEKELGGRGESSIIRYY